MSSHMNTSIQPMSNSSLILPSISARGGNVMIPIGSSLVSNQEASNFNARLRLLERLYSDITEKGMTNMSSDYNTRMWSLQESVDSKMKQQVSSIPQQYIGGFQLSLWANHLTYIRWHWCAAVIYLLSWLICLIYTCSRHVFHHFQSCTWYPTIICSYPHLSVIYINTFLYIWVGITNANGNTWFR